MTALREVSRQEPEAREEKLHVLRKGTDVESTKGTPLHSYLLAAGVLCLALLVRLEVLFRHGVSVDADEAIVGLMAKHILEGHGIPTFYYGQHYMGSFEPMLVALSFFFFGISSWALKLVPLLFSLLLIPLTGYLTAAVAPARLKRESGWLAALFVALPAAPLALWSSKARGGFMEVIVVGALALFIMTTWLKHRKDTFSRTAVIALLLGFGWWTNNQIIFFMGPIGLFMLLYSLRSHKFLRTVSHLVIGLVTFILGGLPFWIYNVRSDFVSFSLFGASADLGENLTGLFTSALPMILGARLFWHSTDTFPGATVVVGALFAVCLSVILGVRRRQILQLIKGRVFAHEPVELLILFLVGTCSIFVLSSFGFLSTAPRYLLPLYVAIYPLAALAISVLGEKTRLGSAFLAVAVLSINFYSLFGIRGSLAGEPLVYKGERVQRDHEELIRWLQSHDIRYVRTNYWIGYKLAFETKENVKFSVFQEPMQVRIPEYEESVSAAAHDVSPFILTPRQSQVVAEGLSSLGYTFSRHEIGGYVVLTDISAPNLGGQQIRLDNARIAASHHESALLLLKDNSLQTRWGSASPQSPGMWVEISLPEPETLVRLTYALGAWASDYPRGLHILCGNEGAETSVLNDRQYSSVQYLRTGIRSPVLFLDLPVPQTSCSSLRFVQLASHPVLDWSIAELALFRKASVP